MIQKAKLDIAVSMYISLFEKQFTSYQKVYRDKKVGVLVSGGIDSSIVAFFAQKYFPEAVFLSLTTAKGVDEPFVKLLGEKLLRKAHFVEVNAQQIDEKQAEIVELLKNAQVEISPMQQALASVYYFLFQEAKTLGIEVIFTGQGPDILLAGYNKYKHLPLSEVKTQIAVDMLLLETDDKRDGAMAKRWSIELKHPYLEPDFVEFTQTLPGELLIHENCEKYISRLVGEKIGLPEAIYDRPKKAMQYSTGVQKILLKP